MSLVKMNDLLVHARERKLAVAAFECWNSANILAIAEGAAECDMPVILQASPVEYGYMGGPDALREIAELYVKKTGATAALHLDHGTTLDQVRECICAGFTSVMLDGSRLPLSENLELSRRAASIAHAHNVSIEAELGRIGGSEAGFEEEKDAGSHMTDPVQAEIFVRESGIDCLAVGIGTVHGDYHGEPKLDLERLGQIADLVSVPLVLHGGSGTPPHLILQAIALGVAKINICTEIHKTRLQAIEQAKKELTPSVPGKFYRPVHEAMKKKVIEIIELFRNGKTW